MDVKLQSSHTELTKEQQKCRELERLLANYKNVITELQDDIEQTNKQNKENSAKVCFTDFAKSSQWLFHFLCIAHCKLWKQDDNGNDASNMRPI